MTTHYRSPRLATRHGFSTRQGGVSTGRYASLNLGAKWGDAPAAVAENRARLAQAGGYDQASLFTARQVHGAAVVVVRAGDAPAVVAEQEADALVTDRRGVALGVYTADCVPVLISDGEGRVAAVHAGWRGAAAGVVGAAVTALVRLGAWPDRLTAALGPSICVGCFEVGEEVAAQFEPRWPQAVEHRPGARPHVDLALVVAAQLAAAGLGEGKIDARPPCTSCEAERFYSYRRDGGETGQQLSFIVC